MAWNRHINAVELNPATDKVIHWHGLYFFIWYKYEYLAYMPVFSTSILRMDVYYYYKIVQMRNLKPQIEEQTLHSPKSKGTKVQTTIYKTQRTTQKTKDWAKQTPLKLWTNSGAPLELAVPAPLITPVVLLLNETNVTWHGIRISKPA